VGVFPGAMPPVELAMQRFLQAGYAHFSHSDFASPFAALLLQCHMRICGRITGPAAGHLTTAP
jgi:hypothetical protein